MAKAGGKGGGPAAPAPGGTKGASRPGSAAGRQLDSGNAAAKVEELKRKLLDTNRQIKQLEEKQKTSDLLSTIDLYQGELGGDVSGMAEREQLRKELELKEAKYTVAKNEFDKLDKEYKEYAEKQRQLEQQAQIIQEQIQAQERQKRDVERDIKKMKLDRDADSDQKNILADLKEELALLKEENKQLNQDSMSGKSLQAKSQEQDQAVMVLREENEVLVKAIDEQSERKEMLSKRLQDAQKQQNTLAKEVAEKSREVEELNSVHKELVSNLRGFSVDPDASMGQRPQPSQEPTAAKADSSDDLVVQACVALNEQLTSRNISADAAFKSWDSNGDDMLSQDEFVEGVMGLRAGLQRDEARQLFVLTKGDADQMTKDKFMMFLSKTASCSTLAVGSEEAEVLEGELRKLRATSVQLLKEKDELFQTLRDAERARKGQAEGGELELAERLLHIEQNNAAQLRKLQDDLAVAEYNQQDLMQLISTYEDSRVRKPGAPSVARGGPRTGNVVVVEIISLKLDAGRLGVQDEPTTFFSVDFYAHDTQVTPPCTGFDVNIGWKGEFEVEEDDLFLGYLDTDTMNLDLNRRVNEATPFVRLASCRVSCKGLLDRASLMNQTVDLIAPDGNKLGQAVLQMRMQHSIFASVERYRRSEKSKVQTESSEANAGLLEALGVPLDKIQLSVTIEKCEGLRASRYGALPKPYCSYEFPIALSADEAPHNTETRTKEANPIFNDRKVWDIPDTKLALALRTQELQVFVFDDDEAEDAPHLGFAKMRLAPIFLAPAQPLKATLDLEHPRGIKNGTITISVEWYTPATVAAEKQRKAMEKAAAIAPASAASGALATTGVPAGSEVRKTWAKRKVSTAKVGGAEEDWLEMLRNRIKEVGDSADKVFVAFDKDGDGELSFDDFKTSIENEPLGLAADQIRKLFDFIAGDKDKDITKAKFRDAVAPGTFGILPADKEHMVLLYRQLSFISSSPMWEEIVKEKGKTRFAVVTDWFTQSEAEMLPTTAAQKLLVTARRATAEFSHKEVYRMDSRVNRARIEAILANEASSAADMIEIILCKVTDSGTVLLDDYVAKASFDIRSILKDKADVSEMSLQLVNSEGKGVAKLTVDTGMYQSMTALNQSGVGAVASNLSAVDFGAAQAAKLAQLMSSKGVSVIAAFKSFDENCDDEIDWEEFQAGIRNEPLDLDDGGRRRLFDYMCDGKKTIDQASWKSKLQSSAVSASGVVTAKEAKEAVVVMVKSAKVNDSILKERQIKYLSVRADFTRQANAKIASTEVRPLKQGSSSVELNDRLTMSLKSDGTDAEATRNRKHLLDAFAPKSQTEAKIEVILVGMTDEGGGKRREFELGTNSFALDLKKLFRDGDDLPEISIQVENEGSAVGKVVLSLYFIQALKALNVDGKSPLKPSGSGASGAKGVTSEGTSSGSGSGNARGGGGDTAGIKRSTSTGSAKKSSSAGGHVALIFSELKLKAANSLASEDKVQHLFLSANFLGLQSDGAVAKTRSSAIALDDLRGDKNKTKSISHIAKFEVDDGLYAANQNELAKVLTSDEDPSTGLVTIVLYRGLTPGEYNADGDTKVVATGDLSMNDMLHASLIEVIEDEKKDVVLKDTNGDEVASCKVAMDFSKVTLPAVRGHLPFAQDDMDTNVVIQVRSLQTMSSKLRGVASIAIGVKLDGGKDFVRESRSRAIRTKDLTAGEHPRGDLCLNHKILLSLAGTETLRLPLLENKKTPIKLIMLNAADDSEIAECDVDLKKDILDKAEDMVKKEVTFLDFDGNTKVARGVVDISVLPAVAVLSTGTTSADGSIGDSTARPPTEMFLAVKKVDVEKVHLAEDLKFKKLFLQVKWFGSRVENSIAYQPAASLPLKHEFKLDVTSEYNNTAMKDLLSERFAKEAARTGVGDVQIFLVAQLDGAGADRVVASGTLDIGAMFFDGEQHGDGQREIFLVAGSATDAAATAAAASGTKLTIEVGFRQALAQIAVRMAGRQNAAPKDKGATGVMNRKEGAQISSKSEKDSNLIVSVKGVELSRIALSDTKVERNGPLFLAVDFFDDPDAAAITGSDAFLRQPRLPISARFLCPVDSEHAFNRKTMKAALDKKDLNIQFKLFHEPWKPGARSWATGKIASSEFMSRNGADLVVELMDEDIKIGSAIIQVHTDATKMLGL